MKIAKGKEKEYQKWVDANRDFYGKGVIDFGVRWAELLEAIIDKTSKDMINETIYNNAEQTSLKADTEYITGFQYGCAVRFLAEVWEYGKILNAWHNNQYGYDENTEGTINPAVLAISKRGN